MATALKVVCARTDCQLAGTGTCSEGHSPVQSCPNFGKLPNDDGTDDDFDDASDSDGEPGALVSQTVPVASGEALQLEEVRRFLLWKPANFIAFVGDNFSGKTTLLCALYDRFLHGPFAGLTFAGSSTLVGIERRAHHARVESNLNRPDTRRTTTDDDLRFFHFALCPTDRPGHDVHLMLSDRAGEFFRNARANSALVPELVELTFSDRVVLLLDGGRLSDPVECAGAMHGVRQALRAFLDNGALGATSNVQVVTTKVDRLGAAAEDGLLTRVQEFRAALATDFEKRLGKLTFWDISARDPDLSYPPAHGMAELLQDWISVVPPTGVPRLRSTVSPRSEFDRMLFRTKTEEMP